MLKIYREQKEFGCILCRILGVNQESETEIHHLRTGMGLSQRGTQCIPLCVKHHRENQIGYHGLGRKGFENKYSLKEIDLLCAWEVASDTYPNWSDLNG